jgi:hypothetical protein
MSDISDTTTAQADPAPEAGREGSGLLSGLAKKARAHPKTAVAAGAALVAGAVAAAAIPVARARKKASGTGGATGKAKPKSKPKKKG